MMGYTKYDPVDGEYHDRSGKSINFVSPLPIEECVSRMNQLSYGTLRDPDRLRIVSMTPKEYLITSYIKGRYGDLIEVMSGRLIGRESGGTHVFASAISPTFLFVIGGVAIVFGIFGAASQWAGWQLGWVVFALGVLAVIQGLRNPYATEVLAQIQLLLHPNPPKSALRKRRKRYYDA